MFKQQDIQIIEDDGYIRVVYRGDAQYDAVTEMLRTVAGLAADKQITRLLIDIREANYDHYHVETIRHTEEATALGFNRNFRIVFVGHTNDQMLRFIENVTVNRGYKTKVFIEEPLAVAWLGGN